MTNEKMTKSDKASPFAPTKVIPRTQRFFLILLFCFSGLAEQSAAADKPFTCEVMPGSPRLSALATSVSSNGIQKLIFYRVRFPDDKSDPITLSEAEETLAETDAIFRRTSEGKFGLAWTVSPILNLANGRDTYGPNGGGFDRIIDDAARRVR